MKIPVHELIVKAGRIILLAALSVILMIGMVACVALPETNTPVPSPSQFTSATAADSQTDFVSAVQKVLPSVVKIEVKYNPLQNPYAASGATGASGTGWVVERGVIVTNHHVIANSQSITVVLADGTRLTPEATESDPAKDLAVLKISDRDLPPLSIGDSSKLVLGQPVAAIGNSLNLGIRVTTGVVSLLNISINSQNVQYSGLIETDATINPGNSGGVLINASGQVVGITNAGLQDPTIDPESFGYAISINEAMPIIKNLISKMP